MTTQVGHIPEQSRGAGWSVAVVAGDAVARRRLSTILEHGGVVVQVRSADAASLGADAFPQVAVLVPGAGRADPAEVRELRARLPDAKIVGVLRAPVAGSVRRALELGVDGVVEEDAVAITLVPTIGAVCAGQVVVPRPFRSDIQKPVFSSREKQVLALVVMGLTNGEIAGRLYLAESTVKSHLSSAFSKLGVRSRSEAAALIVDPERGLGPGILAITPAGQPLAPV